MTRIILTDPNSVDEWAEAWSYFLIKASNELAIEQGACPGVCETRYADGVVPMDTRKTDVDELAEYVERQDWASLRENLRKFGVRNSTLMALMQKHQHRFQILQTVLSFRSLVSVKQSKHGVLKQVVPHSQTEK